MQLIQSIAKVSRPDGMMPNERDIGRECYAFSEQEDRAFGVVESEARNILKGLNEGMGGDYAIEADAIGNLFIRLYGTDPNAKAIMVGSHVDSVAEGGMYDGVAGVAVALDTLAQSVSRFEKPKQDLIVAIWRSEESSPRNGIACLGSSIATGALSEEQLNSIMYDRENNISLRDHITKRGNVQKPPDPNFWEKVLALAKTPQWSSDNVQAYFEAHIEQSAVIDVNNTDVGIVTGGIGGARRDRIAATFEPEMIEAKEGEYEKIVLSFLGEPTHTGGTPPNPAFMKETRGFTWYRKDALVAASRATNRLLRIPGIKLLRTGPDRATGFTSVPGRQDVELLVPVARKRIVSSILLGLKSHLRVRFQVEMDTNPEKREKVPASTVTFVSRSRAREAFDLPQITSALSTERFHKEGTPTGTTRATVTDFYMTPDGVMYNLDLREVNLDDLDRLVKDIHKHTNLTLGEGAYRTISVKTHAPVDGGLVERLQQHAEKLGISFVLMPSMPGHDADRMAARGIRTAMVFIRHDGLSHNPKEAMKEKDFSKSTRTIQEAIAEMQGY